MARSKKPVDAGYVLYDVLYQDGSRTSNRKIPNADLDPFDRDGSIRASIERQDRKIAEMSGNSRAPIKAITRSSAA